MLIYGPDPGNIVIISYKPRNRQGGFVKKLKKINTKNHLQSTKEPSIITTSWQKTQNKTNTM